MRLNRTSVSAGHRGVAGGRARTGALQRAQGSARRHPTTRARANAEPGDHRLKNISGVILLSIIRGSFHTARSGSSKSTSFFMFSSSVSVKNDCSRSAVFTLPKRQQIYTGGH
jgi:hypothetical protein